MGEVDGVFVTGENLAVGGLGYICMRILTGEQGLRSVPRSWDGIRKGAVQEAMVTLIFTFRRWGRHLDCRPTPSEIRYSTRRSVEVFPDPTVLNGARSTPPLTDSVMDPWTS